MDWFKVQPIGGRTRDVTVGPWSCDFEPIGSLLPSSNTSTVGECVCGCVGVGECVCGCVGVGECVCGCGCDRYIVSKR